MPGDNRIDDLQRLSRLRSEGALTEEEFGAEKRRVLGRDQTSASRPAALMIVAGVLISMMGALAFWWLWTPTNGDIRPIEGSSQAPVRSPAAMAAGPSPTSTPTIVPPMKVAAVDDALVFSSPATCVAGETLAGIYDMMDKAMESGAPNTVKLDAFSEPIKLISKSGKDKDGGWSGSAELRMPSGATWHGMRLSRVTSGWYRPPETDSVHERTITFHEEPAKLLRTLNRLGFKAVLAPSYSELPDTYNSCGGSMSVERRPGGSALSCSWGC